MGEACSTYGREESCIQGFGGKPEGRRPLERLRYRWENNVKMDLHEAGCGDMDWIDLVQDRDRRRALVNAVLHLRVP